MWATPPIVNGCFSQTTIATSRLRDSKEADAVVIAYDYGRCAYYASLLDCGITNVWPLWQACRHEFRHPMFRERLLREFEGAAKYLKAIERPRLAVTARERTGKMSLG
jgi:hypothetical protein